MFSGRKCWCRPNLILLPTHQVRSLSRVHILCVFYTCTVQFSCVYAASDNVEINENTTTATTTGRTMDWFWRSTGPYVMTIQQPVGRPTIPYKPWYSGASNPHYGGRSTPRPYIWHGEAHVTFSAQNTNLRQQISWNDQSVTPPTLKKCDI